MSMYDKLKRTLAEVSQPLSKGEKNFKALHKIDHKNLVPGVTDQDHIFNGNKRREDPKSASYENFRDDDESVEAYDQDLKTEETPDTDKDVNEATLSAKAGRAGKDLGKPGKEFHNIAAKAAKKYGSKAAGERVAGSILAKMRAKKMHKEEAEAVDEALGTMKSIKAGAMKGYEDSRRAQQLAMISSSDKDKLSKVAAMMKKERDAKKKMAREETELVDEAKTRTPAYIGTVHKDDPDYDKKVAELKSKATGGAKLRGRAPKAEFKHLYKKKNNDPGSHRPSRDIKVQHASRVDVYSRKADYRRNYHREEVEQIDELSPATLGSYIKKASNDVALSGLDAGRNRAATEYYKVAKKKMSDRLSNIAKATDRLTKEEVEQVEEEHQYIEVISKTGAKRHIKVHPSKAFAALNQYKKDGNKARIVSNKPMKEDAEQVDEVLSKKAPIGSWISDFVHSKNPKFAGKSKKERMKQAMAAYYSKQRNEAVVDQGADWEGQMAKTELSAISDKASKLISMINDKDDLEAWVQSKISYAKVQLDGVYDYMTYGDQHKPENTPDTYSQSGQMASSYGNFMSRMGEEVELDEAKRGRPRKNASSSDSEVEGGADMHPMMQARKAISLRGQHTFTHKSGESYKMEPSMAHKILAHHDNLKTAAQKQEFSDRVAHSKAEMNNALAGKPAVKKPKVSLGSMKKEDADPSTKRAARGAMEVKVINGRPEFIKGSKKEIKVEELIGGQKKLDKNHNGKLDKMDFKLLRKKKKMMEAEEMTAANVAKAAATQTRAGVVDNRNMQQDSVDKISKDVQASGMKIKLPPTQGNKPIGGDTQTHPEMAEELLLNNLYDTLSEQNKEKFEKMIETEEGYEYLLNFAKEQDL